MEVFTRIARLSRLVLLAAVCLAAAALPAIAQSPEGGRYGDQSLSAGAVFNGAHLQYGDHWTLGAGAFVDANLTWRYGIEGEATWTRWHEHLGTHANTYLIGPRYRFPGLHNARFAPYAKFLIGAGGFTFPTYNGFSTGSGSYFVMAPGGGIDYRWKPRFDLRLCDVEYQIWPTFTFGSNTDLSVSAGLRYHIF